MHRFTHLKVWQRAHVLALRLEIATQKLGLHDAPGLWMELHCAANAIPATIAQAYRASGKRAPRLWAMAQSSTTEAEELLLLCRDMGFFSVEAAAPFLDEFDKLVQQLEPATHEAAEDSVRVSAARS